MLADRFGLTDAEREQLLPSGSQPVIANRVAWTKTYLKKAGLIAQPTRGVVRITDDGRAALAKKPDRIDNVFLRQYPGFTEFYGRTTPAPADGESVRDAATPEEALEASFTAMNNALADELLEKVKACSPAFFERLVVELLVAMGYGGSLADAGRAAGPTAIGPPVVVVAQAEERAHQREAAFRAFLGLRVVAGVGVVLRVGVVGVLGALDGVGVRLRLRGTAKKAAPAQQARRHERQQRHHSG